VRGVGFNAQSVQLPISPPISINQRDERARAVSIAAPKVKGNLGASGETQEEFSVSSEGYNVSANMSRGNSIQHNEPLTPIEEVNQGESRREGSSSSGG